MRGLAETRPLEGFPVSLLKMDQISSPKLTIPCLSGSPSAGEYSRPCSRQAATPSRTMGRIIQSETEVLQTSRTGLFRPLLFQGLRAN